MWLRLLRTNLIYRGRRHKTGIPRHAPKYRRANYEDRLLISIIIIISGPKIDGDDGGVSGVDSRSTVIQLHHRKGSLGC